MKIAVVGTGYVGLVAGTGFSDFGNDVICIDVDDQRIADLRKGLIPIHEPGLEPLVKRNVEAGRLTFSTDTETAVRDVDVVILAVGTPTSADGSAADLQYVDEAARQVGRGITQYTVIVNKSTVPVGTADRVRKIVAAETKQEFSVASNPEFLKEGDAVNDFMKPARVILGADDDRAREVLQRLYSPFVRTNNRIQVMDVKSAELTKYAANAMLATRISFMNEIALLAEKVGADVEQVRRGIGSDPRIGPKFLYAGPGFGGSCFPKDMRALIHTAKEYDTHTWIVDAAERVNNEQKHVLGRRVLNHFGGDIANKTFGVWGLAFKPETDDTRESPAFVVIEDLLNAGATIRAYDPVAVDNARVTLGDRVEYADSMYDAVEGAHGVILVTEWHQFRRPDFERMAKLMANKVAFDGRNVWTPSELQSLGFHYYGIGRPALQ